MRNRLTRITTRGGDHGDSGLADGTRHAKTAPVFAALGDIDELNCVLGIVVASLPVAHDLRECLLTIQSRLFDLGGAIATPGSTLSLLQDTLELEALVARYTPAAWPARQLHPARWHRGRRSDAPCQSRLQTSRTQRLAPEGDAHRRLRRVPRRVLEPTERRTIRLRASAQCGYAGIAVATEVARVVRYNRIRRMSDSV